MYFVDMKTPLQKIPTTVKSWIEKEICPGGLLEEINTFMEVYRADIEIEGPAILFHKLDWTFLDEEKMTMGCNSAVISYPFEIAIAVTLDDDVESDDKAIQLQSKVISSIAKNFNKNIFTGITQPPIDETEYDEALRHGYIQHWTIQTGYNDGSLAITNAEENIVSTGILLILEININWLHCVRRVEQEKTDK